MRADIPRPQPPARGTAPAGAAPLRRPLTALPDLELAALSAAGSRAGFGELVRRHNSAIRVLLRRMGADASAADDIAQDAFLIAFERIGEFRGEGGFCPWVRRIAARLYVRRWRKESKTQALGDDEREDDIAHSLSPGEGDRADRIDLEAALSALSKSERICVSLCFGAGLTHAEAAEVLGAPIGTVKSHVKRGLEKLRKRMGADVAAPVGLAAQAS